MTYKPSSNSKALTAREKKKIRLDAIKEANLKIIEDKKWEDNDKHYNASIMRKAVNQQKLDEKMQRKQELRQLEIEEKKKIDSSSKTKVKDKSSAPKKITQAEINLRLLSSTNDKDKIEKNINHEIIDQIEDDDPNYSAQFISLSSVQEALNYFEDKSPKISHPERKMKAGHLEFQSRMMPIVKSENPTLKKSQLEQMIFKMWQKSPDNPFNQT